MKQRIMDVSEFNGKVDWETAKAHIDGAIVRAGYRGYGIAGTLMRDKRCLENLNGAAAAGVPVGVYFLSQAKTKLEAVAEADFVHRILAGYNIKLPVYLDSEWSNANHNGRADGLSKTKRTAYAKAFCDRIKERGHTPGVYASESWFRDKLDFTQLTGYSIWVAKYSSKAPSTERYDGWQYTDSGSVTGVSGSVDLSVFEMENEAAKQQPGLAQEAEKTPAAKVVPMMQDKSKAKGVTLTVTAKSGLRLRKAAPDGDTVEIYAKGSRVRWYGYYTKVIATGEVWYYVLAEDGAQGYMSAAYLR